MERYKCENIRKLKDHKYANCHVGIQEFEFHTLYQFVSYDTVVINVAVGKKEGRWIECTGLYSRTTRKQIGWFLKEYFPELTYQDIKKIVEEDKGIVIF